MKWLRAWIHDGAPPPPCGEEVSELRAELVQAMLLKHVTYLWRGLISMMRRFSKGLGVGQKIRLSLFSLQAIIPSLAPKFCLSTCYCKGLSL